jgi:hypothetical protein
VMKFMTGKNILRFTFILLLVALLFPPLENQGILYFSDRYFLLTLPRPLYFVAVDTLIFEYAVIALIGAILYTFKKD